MATQIQLQSTNYNGQIAAITFYPCSGGTISLGNQTIPYTYTNDNYEGTYDLYFSAFNQTCQLVITCPTPTPTTTRTPTPTPTLTRTPTLTPTPTNVPLCPQQIVVSNATTSSYNGTYDRLYANNDGPFIGGTFSDDTDLFTTGAYLGNVYAVYGRTNGSGTYYTLVYETFGGFVGYKIYDTTTNYLTYPTAVIGSDTNITTLTITDGSVYYPKQGVYTNGTISYPAVCPTPTPTNTSTPTLTPTNTSTPSPTPVYYNLLAENADFILAENGDNINIQN
jgi:hypothetical protein